MCLVKDYYSAINKVIKLKDGWWIAGRNVCKPSDRVSNSMKYLKVNRQQVSALKVLCSDNLKLMEPRDYYYLFH